MSKIKIIIKSKEMMQSLEKFAEIREKEIENYINEGYEIKASNLLSVNGNPYIYVLLEKK